VSGSLKHVATAEAFVPATPDLVLTDLALSLYCWQCRYTLQNANDFERHLDHAAVTAMGRAMFVFIPESENT
jgi:hypothetical protein